MYDDGVKTSYITLTSLTEATVCQSELNRLMTMTVPSLYTTDNDITVCDAIGILYELGPSPII